MEDQVNECETGSEENHKISMWVYQSGKTISHESCLSKTRLTY